MTNASKKKGSAFELEAARLFGGHRTPGSGAMGGGDLTFEKGTLWSGLSWECKRPKKLPVMLTAGIMQARLDIPIGDPRLPALLMREDDGDAIIAFPAVEFRRWVEAIAETGSRQNVLSHIRQVRRDLDALEKAVR